MSGHRLFSVHLGVRERSVFTEVVSGHRLFSVHLGVRERSASVQFT